MKFLTLTSLILSLLMAPVHAATDLSDIPMAVKNTVKPNVMFTLDDSGSMQFELIPESLITDGIVYTFPQSKSFYGSSYYYYTPGGNLAVDVGGYEAGSLFNVRYRSAFRNKIYYNPETTYRPWSNADGSLMANASTTCAYHNPRNTALGCRNLTVLNNGNANTTTDSYAWWMRYNGTAYSWVLGNYVDGISGVSGFWPSTYFNYNSANAGCTVSNLDDTDCYSRIEVKSTTATYVGGANRTDCAAKPSCTYAEEIQNFANWYQYYRSRVLTARAGIGHAFSQQLNGSMRVGFGAINKGSSSVDGATMSTVSLGVRLFSGADRTTFFSNLYDHAIPTSGTPLRRALDDVGQYFSRADDQGPWGENPGSSGGTQWACRQNYNILMTDGYWNGDEATTAGAKLNVDNTAGSTKTTTGVTPAASYTYTPVNPYSDSYSNSLADVAMYYWVNDLRALDNKVPTNTKDPAFWQHLVNFTVGLGVYGTVSKADVDSAFTATPATISWPDPTASDTNKVDDLAHAAVNSHGGYFSASDPDSFATSLSKQLDDIIGRNGAAAAVAVSNANVTSGDNASYASKYNSGNWSGDLQSYAIDLTTGIPSSTPTWGSSAQAQLDLLSVSSRKIATYTGTTGTGQGRPFQASGCGTASDCISSAQQATLNTPFTNPGLTDGAAVLAYLRGTRTGESAGTYRTRTHVLGDIINAEPVIIREPSADYADTCYMTAVTGKCTTAFKTAQAARTKVVAQGANDGMMHMFLAATGAESWAYVPNLLFNTRDAAYPNASTLNMLSRQSGYSHKYFVDATPVAGDVDFSNTSAVSGNPDPDWRTILVGGLGKGGRGYYALDVTSPGATSEADAASKVLWEFPNSATNATLKLNIGYTYGKPIIVKTAAYGWVVLVTSGYNNGTDSGGDGIGYLWVLDAKTGNVLQSISTTVGSAANPSGLAFIAAYVENGSIDNTTDYVYGGDLEGNVWRFDLTDSTGGITYTVKRLAILKDASGATQPVTTVPELSKISIGGVDKRFVYVGTGRYLGESDVDSNGTQSMYGLVDDLSVPSGITPVISDPVRSSLQVQTLTTSSATERTSSATTVDFSTKKGWYIDLPGCSTLSGLSCSKGAERVNTDPVLVLGALVFSSNIPSGDQCTPGGSSWLTILDYKTGGFLTGSTVAWSSSFLGDALSSRPVPIKLPSGAVKVLVRKSNDTIEVPGVPLPSSSTSGSRISWREVTE